MPVIKVARTLRSHWKKSIFFTGAVAYIGDYFYTKHKITLYMREVSREALKYGDQYLQPTLPTRHVTVILNPVAKGRKCKSQFEDYVAPLLHCAGIRVSVIETEHKAQAVDLMGVMNNTDAVIIAGGNGTLHDAITGLLRREDAEQFASITPISILPLGKKNDFFNRLYKSTEEGPAKLQEVKLLAESAMRVIRGETEKINVLQAFDEATNRSVYALNNFEFGRMSAIRGTFHKYWYFGETLGQYFALLRSTIFKPLSDLVITDSLPIYYTTPCEGCSKCYATFVQSDVHQAKERSKSWWNAFRSSVEKREDQLKIQSEQAMKNRINDLCGTWQLLDAKNVFNVEIENDIKSNVNSMELKVHEQTEDLSKTQFFDQTRLIENYSQVQKVVARDVFITLPEHLQLASKPETENVVSKDEQLESTDKNSEYINENQISKQTDSQVHIDEKNIPSEEDLKEQPELNYLVDGEIYERSNRLNISSLRQKLLVFK